MTLWCYTDTFIIISIIIIFITPGQDVYQHRCSLCLLTDSDHSSNSLLLMNIAPSWIHTQLMNELFFVECQDPKMTMYTKHGMFALCMLQKIIVSFCSSRLLLLLKTDFCPLDWVHREGIDANGIWWWENNGDGWESVTFLCMWVSLNGEILTG